MQQNPMQGLYCGGVIQSDEEKCASSNWDSNPDTVVLAGLKTAGFPKSSIEDRK
jgi:hypothetical protein